MTVYLWEVLKLPYVCFLLCVWEKVCVFPVKEIDFVMVYLVFNERYHISSVWLSLNCSYHI